MAQEISVAIRIHDRDIHAFSSLKLHQPFDDHHSFELQLNHDALEEPGAMTMHASRALLGKAVTISLQTIPASGPAHEFKGIVTSVGFSNSLDSAGDLIISGYSPTILLECGPGNKSFLDISLNLLVQNMLSEAPANDLARRVKPVKNVRLPYAVQYRESHFAFLRRLAATYGEWFFYDSSTLYFGRPEQAPELELGFPADISDMKLQMRLSPLGFVQRAYLHASHEAVQKASKGMAVEGLDPLGQEAMRSSEQLFTAEMHHLSHQPLSAASELDEAVQLGKAQQASELVRLIAQSDNPYVRPGARVSIRAEGSRPTALGAFTVLSVTHSVNGLGDYHNQWEGMPAGVAVPPGGHIQKPLAEPQLGVVVSNKDPEHKGRVQVKLYAFNNELTPFIPVMSPHAGTAADGAANRGLHFTPELDECVLVGFTQHDPERPFVMGSVPHGKAVDSAANTDNHIKMIRTRSGSTIYFHDRENSSEQEIRIETDAENFISILLKDQQGDVQIRASKAITVQAAESMLLKSKEIQIEASDSISIKANQKIEINASEVLVAGSKEFAATGGSTATLEGAQTEVKGTSSAKITAASLSLEGSGMASLKAPLVKIN